MSSFGLGIPLGQFLVAMRILLRLGAVIALRCLALEDQRHGTCSRGGGRGRDRVSMKVAVMLCVAVGLLPCAAAGAVVLVMAQSWHDLEWPGPGSQHWM